MKNSFSFSIFLLACVVSTCLGYSKTLDCFNWVDQQIDPKLFAEIKRAFDPELQPDDPVKKRPYAAYAFKYIWRVGIYRSSCLVLIGHRLKEDDDPEFDYFRAYNYNLKNGKKQRIKPSKIFYKWTFVCNTFFESTMIPDIVFRYHDCMECEAHEYLSSFRYDEGLEGWALREWPTTDSRILIASDVQIGLTDNWQYDCLFAIADFTDDGYNDVVVRCRTTGMDTKAIREWILLYTIMKGAPMTVEVKEGDLYQSINKALCDGQKNSPLCK